MLIRKHKLENESEDLDDCGSDNDDDSRAPNFLTRTDLIVKEMKDEPKDRSEV